MKEVYDIVNKEYIRANTVKELCDKIGVDSSSFYRLRNGFTKTLNHRYLLNHEEGFILVDIDSKEEFHCANKNSFFILLNVDYEESISKYIYELIKGRQKTFSFMNRIFHLKGVKPIRAAGQCKARNSKWLNERKEVHKLHKKLSGKLRANLVGCIRRQDLKKRKTFSELSGCSYSFLLEWLEEHFEE